MSAPMHIMDRDGIVHRCLYEQTAEEWGFEPIVCGGGIVAPGHRVGGPPTCEWCKANKVEPGWEQL